LYAAELARSERVRILIRNIYGYYVVERVLMRCQDEGIKEDLRNEVIRNLSYLSNKALRTKWQDLVERSRSGQLLFIFF